MVVILARLLQPLNKKENKTMRWQDVAGMFEVDFDLMSWAFTPANNIARHGYLNSVMEFQGTLYFMGSSPVNERVSGQYNDEFGVAYVTLAEGTPRLVVAGAITDVDPGSNHLLNNSTHEEVAA